MTQNKTDDGNGRIDRVKETYRDTQMGVKVETVARRGYDGEEHDFVKVYGKRSDRFKSLDGSGSNEVERYVKIAEFPSAVATEVLFGLAESRDYELRGK